MLTWRAAARARGPQDGQRLHVFGQGGVARAAAAAGVELLGEVPLLSAIREASDAGVPLAADAAAPEAAAYRAIAARLAYKLRLRD